MRLERESFTVPGYSADVAQAIEDSIAYLRSPEAIASLREDPYWPKWHSPWWHMVALWEMGEARRIARDAPQALAEMVSALAGPYYLRSFPKLVSEIPAGKSLHLHSMCPCGIGAMYQVLRASGVDVDREVRWLRARLSEDVLPDGGITCDWEAYLKDPSASSMVGTIPILEALLMIEDRTEAEERVLERGVEFLLRRELRLGSHDDEREDEADWLKPCFPRFYFYDVLRGLRLIARWSNATGRKVPREAISRVVTSLKTSFPDGMIRSLRESTEGWSTLARVNGEWKRKQPATRFALLDVVSRIGEPSPWLTREWHEARRQLGV